MQRVKRNLISPMGLVAVALAAVAITLGVYAFTTAQQDKSTGSFTIAAESTAIEVKTYDHNGNEVSNGAWCARPALFVGDTWQCAFTVKNLKTTSDITYQARVLSYVNGDTKNLGSQITVQARNHSDLSSCPLFDGGSLFGPSSLSSLPSFGDPTPGHASRPPAGRVPLAGRRLHPLRHCLARLHQSIGTQGPSRSSPWLGRPFHI